eukprot:7704038-Prorocentrum_lima.AAC.1
MTSSLVGSEMCIRDSVFYSGIGGIDNPEFLTYGTVLVATAITGTVISAPVSYTHLTLPTICSV